MNVSGLRVDGRRPNEVRRIRSQLGIFTAADGSAIVEHGNTKVIASVHGPREAKRRGDVEHNQAFINVEFGMAPFATAERRKRRAGDRKFQEASTALRQSFETVVQTKLYPRSEIDVYIQVLQWDGGAMAAAINAGTLALIDAGVAMKDFVVACSVAYIQRTALLGVCFATLIRLVLLSSVQFVSKGGRYPTACPNSFSTAGCDSIRQPSLHLELSERRSQSHGDHGRRARACCRVAPTCRQGDPHYNGFPYADGCIRGWCCIVWKLVLVGAQAYVSLWWPLNCVGPCIFPTSAALHGASYGWMPPDIRYIAKHCARTHQQEGEGQGGGWVCTCQHRFSSIAARRRCCSILLVNGSNGHHVMTQQRTP